MSFLKPSLFHCSKSKLWIALVCASLTIGGTIASTVNLPALSQPTPRTDTMKPTPAPAVIQSIRRAVKQQFGVAKMTVVSVTEQTWPDGCLGLPRGKEGCTTAIVPGWRIEVSDTLQTWVYRSDRTGNTLRLENPNRSVLPQAVARKLIQKVARETNTAPAKLRIADVKPQEYGGCLGIYRPNQACTKIAIAGWQVIVISPNQTFIYHLGAEQIVRNETASGAKRIIRVSFSDLNEIPAIAANEIFRSSSSGAATGEMISIVLTQDGKITRYQSSPTAKFAPVVIKRLSSDQLNAFKKGLENRQFPNLNGLSFLTDAALADYPTMTYQSQFATTQFIDLEKKNLPRSLRQVIKSWETLIQP
jgi:hypothetical protein